jgi:hypothetical protein
LLGRQGIAPVCPADVNEDFIPIGGTAGQGVSEEEALKRGTEAKSKAFVEKGAEVYAEG